MAYNLSKPATIPEPHGAKVPGGQTAIGALLSQQPTLSLRRPFGQGLTTPWNWRLNRLQGDDVFKSVAECLSEEYTH